jgi:DNA-binding NtrC family response regulator
MQAALAHLRDRALDLRPVLLHGERGTGKRRLARWLHQRGPRAQGPHVLCQLAGDPEDLIAEVFPQKLKQAEQGSLYLADPEELPASVRPLLLQAIRSLRVWVLAASSAAPDPAEELWQALGVPVEIPALRQRRDDLDSLLAVLVQDLGLPEDIITPAAREVLRAYDWPENVRELKHTIVKAFRANGGAKLKREHLPAHLLARCAP